MMFLFHVAKIETEKMLIAMVETELERRKAEGKYKGSFIGQSHFFGWVFRKIMDIALCIGIKEMYYNGLLNVNFQIWREVWPSN